MSNKNYFDKFIKDELQRAEKIKQRQQEHCVQPEDDLKRRLLRRYRENVAHLKQWKTNG
jgi:hypothetical protein